MHNYNSEAVNALFRSILLLESEEECRAFFEDLCTSNEMRALEQRYDVAVLLDEGRVYTDILERTGASSATISRVNRSLSYGTGAYAAIFERRKQQEEKKK